MLIAFQVILLLTIFVSFVFTFADGKKEDKEKATYVLVASILAMVGTFWV